MSLNLQRLPYHLIVVFKATKAVLLLLLAVGWYTAVTKHLPRDVRDGLDHGFLGAEWEFFDNLARFIGSGERRGALLGGILLAVEVFGLIRNIRGLVLLAAAESAFFAAVGAFQLSRGFVLPVAILVVVHAACAWYLFRGGGRGGGKGSPKGASSKGAKPRKPAR